MVRYLQFIIGMTMVLVETIIAAVMFGRLRKKQITESFMYIQPSSFCLEGGGSQVMKKKDEKRR